MSSRVVVTGISSLTGLGSNTDQLWQSVAAGRSSVKSLPDSFGIDSLDFEYPVKIGSFVPEDFTISEDLIDLKTQSRFDKFTLYSVYCADQLLKSAKLNIGEHYKSTEVGCILGVGMGGFPILENEHHKFVNGNRARTGPFFIPSIIPNMATGMIAIKFGIQGVNYTISSACASSAHSIEAGILQIRSGHHKAMIVGGSESVMTKLTYGGFSSMKALSKRDVAPEKACCPFSLDRDGFVMGEGAALLLIEDLASATSRGANILAEIVGFGSSCDANHITSPHPEGIGATISMNKALKEAQISPSEIDYINAHGTSTPIGDKIETVAIKNVFGKYAQDLNISSTKSMSGHLLGAAAGLESVICVLSILNQIVPPTINLENPDPECDLNYTANHAQKKKINYCLNNAFGFGGTNASLIFKRFE
jgi:3-oxoacyl-[acyl-carrier-protein] synthase II